MFEELKEKLKIELTNDLPGEVAHNMMMPAVRDARMTRPSRQSPPVKSAVLILFYLDENDHIKFPLIQRPTYNGPHSAQVSLPGGKSEPSDKNLVQTALREAKEEIGIDPDQVQIVGKLSDLFIWVSNYLVTPVVGFTDQKPQFQKDELEVDSIIETDLYDIIDLGKRKEDTIRVKGNLKIKTPYFDIDDRIVWGATAMMLSELSLLISRTRII